ncbi:MAG TPA: hypothetical protein EYH58_04530 [Aquifex aeolicus]|nr:hypothetical protein [Aquifex aeolicus]
MKKLIFPLLISLAFATSISQYLLEAEKFFKELNNANTKEATPYLYGKALGYYDGVKIYAYHGIKEGVKRAFDFMERTTSKAVRGAYTSREPITELIIFEPRLFFEEYCDGIIDECFYEERYEKEEFLELVDYFSLQKRIEFLRRNNAKYCSPKDYGKAEALFNLISMELMEENPNEEILLELERKLMPILIMAEEKLRFAMKNNLKCYLR